MLKTIDHGLTRELQLEHPPANALRASLLTVLRHAIDNAPREGAQALIISGIPGYFSAGLDLPYQLEQDQQAATVVFNEIFNTLRAIGTSRLPIVCAMEGHAIGGGTMMATFADYRIMAQGNYKMGMPEVHVGLPNPLLTYHILSRLIGSHPAERMCVEGRLILGDEAERLGLVDELVPQEEVRDRAIAWCENITSLPSRAMRLGRAIARAEIAEILARHGWEEFEELAVGWSRDDTQEALRKMVEKMKSGK